VSFSSPFWLLLLLVVAVVAVVYVAEQLRRKKYVARFSNTELLASIAPRRPGWRRHVTFALLVAALAVMSVGAAHPNKKVRVPRDTATVMLAVDVSLSMKATDVLPDRITAAKKAADTFADLLPPKINLGLVAFSGNADVKVSPTIDRDSFKIAVDGLQLGEQTAIGSAVFSCLDAISTFSKSTTPKGSKAAPARIVLLSDGSSNTGRTLTDAETAAKTAKIAVSTIAFGTPDGTVDIPPYGRQLVPANTAQLHALADATGGSYHTAASVEELTSIYKNIGSQIGYTTARKDISYRFLMAGLLFAFAAAGTSLLWSGRLT
jgi:Ca-activated chloride channel family protein